ncbi:hypothetical protein M422DRAFT_65583 [Sphaerobolus stellatus SS14]|nr:hypothetical protein M422DRAFT_65583 [Sphaerobolus stellatus SS14]
MMSRSSSPTSSSIYYTTTEEVDGEELRHPPPNIKSEEEIESRAISKTSIVQTTTRSVVTHGTNYLCQSENRSTDRAESRSIESPSVAKRSLTFEVVLQRQEGFIQRRSTQSPIRNNTENTTMEEAVSQEITVGSEANDHAIECNYVVRIKQEGAEPLAITKLEPVSEENKVKLEALENPDVKILSGSALSPESVNHRLDAIGLDPYPVTLPDSIRLSTVSRDWMSYTFGGSSQGMYPPIDKSRFTHGIDNFCYLTYDYNPVAPKRPGYPGLQFSCRPEGLAGHPPQMGVYALRCVGYDEDFQRQLHNMPKGWKRPTTKSPKKTPKKAEKRETSRTKAPTRKRKKRDSDSDESQSDADEYMGDSEQISPTRQKSSSKRRKVTSRRGSTMDDDLIDRGEVL